MMKGEMDLDDHHALYPPYRDLVFNLLACPTRCGQMSSAGISVRESSVSLSVWTERTLSRCRARYLDSLFLSVLQFRLCLGDAYRSHVASAMSVGEPGKP